MFLVIVTLHDVREYKVPNIYIISGLAGGLLYQVFAKGLSGIKIWFIGVLIPLVFLFLLYYFHVIGAGDIKLFSVIGGILGIPKVIHIIILSFIIGAVLSAIQLIRFHNLKFRMQFLANYFHTLLKIKKITPYYNHKEGKKGDVIPFTLSITLSVLILLFAGKVG